MSSIYSGMSYTQASKEAERLIKKASVSGNWFPLVAQLTTLKQIMEIS